MTNRNVLRVGCVGLFALASAVGCGRTPLDDFRDGSVPMGECIADTDCDDGIYCNGAETCAGGRCRGGAAVPCDDGVGCTADRCIEASRSCESVPDATRCSAGEICDPVAGCQRRPCTRPRDCRDAFACNGTESCGVDGFCLPGTPLECVDAIDCTLDECSESMGGCAFTPDNRRCDNGVYCDGAERCTRRTGCVVATPVSCDDGDTCTDDSCNEARDTCTYRRRTEDPRCAGPACPDQELGSALGAAVARGTTVGSRSTRAGSCGGDGAPERTFRWRAPRDSGYRIDLVGSDYDTMLYVQRTCTGGELACNDDEAGLQSVVHVALAAGDTVIIVVDGFGTSAGNFVLNITPEGTFVEICTDGVDNDGDGFIDCDDFDCRGRPECGPCTSYEAACLDGRDDDCDGAIDCADPDCFGRPECGPCADREYDCLNGRDDDCDGLPDCSDSDCFGRPECGGCTPYEIDCLNGRDDDCDGRLDCRDSDCFGLPECGGCEMYETSCIDGRDNDCDGLLDCADPECRGRPDCGPCAFLELDCANRRDDDCDGLLDCADPDCRGNPACGPCTPYEINCTNMRDEDCDGSMDCADPDCAGDPACCVPTGRERCGNGIDDDCDRLVDCADPDCRAAPRCATDGGVPDGGLCTTFEIGVAQCTDRLDNDCDGTRDCGDYDCRPFGPGSECCNGIDDDGDGQTDIFTCRCRTNADCRGVGSLEQVCWTTLFSVCAPRCNFYGGDLWCSMIDPSLRCAAGSGECVPR